MAGQKQYVVFRNVSYCVAISVFVYPRTCNTRFIRIGMNEKSLCRLVLFKKLTKKIFLNFCSKSIQQSVK